MQLTEFQFRELNLKNIEEIKELILNIFSREPWNETWTGEQLHQYVLELIGNSNSLSFGLYKGDQLIGISLGRIKHWCEGTEYWIDEFGILPEAQRNGLGTKFLKKIECSLPEKEISALVLLTEKNSLPMDSIKGTDSTKKKNRLLWRKI